MKKLIGTLLAFAVASPLFAMTADEIMAKVDAVESPKTMKSKMTMVLIDKKNKQRKRSMQNTSADIDGVDRTLMFFLEPTDVKGTGFLMLDYEEATKDDDQWMFLPSLNKAKRIASGDKTGSFMGSDFTYADMSKRNLEEWTYKLVKEDEVNGQKVWIVESTPVSKEVIKKTGYVRSIAYIRQDNFQMIRGINYLEKKGEVKLMNVAKTIEMDGFWIGTEMQMISQKGGKTVHKTLMTVSDIELNFEVNADAFTLNRLEQGL